MGVKQPVPAINVPAPSASLLTVARPLPDGTDWRSGIAWSSACLLDTHNWPYCPDAATLTAGKTLAPGAGPLVATDPFVVYTGVECDWVEGPLGDDLSTLCSGMNDAHLAYGISQALWMGVGLPSVADPNYGLPPTLRRTAQDVSIGGVATELNDVVGALLQHYEACTTGDGGAVIHLPTVMLPGALGGTGGGARVCWPEGNFYRGPAGSVVSAGPGYPHGHTPQGPLGAGPLVSGTPPNEVYQGNAFSEVWVYVSGPVEYAVGTTEMVPPDDAQRRVPTRLNRYDVVAERSAIVRFDPCCVFAAKAINTSGEIS